MAATNRCGLSAIGPNDLSNSSQSFKKPPLFVACRLEHVIHTQSFPRFIAAVKIECGV
jgi:hypothetical protein